MIPNINFVTGKDGESIVKVRGVLNGARAQELIDFLHVISRKDSFVRIDFSETECVYQFALYILADGMKNFFLQGKEVELLGLTDQERELLKIVETKNAFGSVDAELPGQGRRGPGRREEEQKTI